MTTPMVHVEGYSTEMLKIELVNQHVVFLNLKDKLHTIRFVGIQQNGHWSKLETDGQFIRWPSGEISYGEVLDLLGKKHEN